jgi:class 3 adenylate cyclase
VDSSRALPTGVVTFLLTDIEGSTRLWEAEPDAMRDALVRHDAIANAVVRRLNGHVVKSKGEGDSVFAVFRHARDAATAALVLQVTLSSEKWPTSRPIRVRMAIHTGQVELRDGDYYGPTVNRCARLRALAKGGQVLLSGVTAKLTEGQLPAGASLQDLGSQQLKDLSTPERVWQLAHPRLAADAAAQPARTEPAKSSAASSRAYVLTDHLNHDGQGREWGERVTHAAVDGEEQRIRCYATPRLALLMNVVEDGFRLPRVWEVAVYPEAESGEAVSSCQRATALRQVQLPTLTGLHHARFAVLAVLAARDAYEGGTYFEEFSDWAAGWIGGEDTSGTAARDLADRLERDARPDSAGFTRLHWLMLANAARAAAHASKLAWLAGRARDEENSTAISLAADAVRTALRLAELDLVSLAEQAIPKAAVPVAPIRPISVVSADRILRALPT